MLTEEGVEGSGSSVTMTLSVQTIVWRCPLTCSLRCVHFKSFKGADPHDPRRLGFSSKVLAPVEQEIS